MQKAINRVDSDSRANKVFELKVKPCYKRLRRSKVRRKKVSVNFIKNRNHRCITGVQRIGKYIDGRPRVDVLDKIRREAVIKQTLKLKQCSELWKKVFLRRDTHPVYAKENQCLRKKMNELKR